MVQTIGQQQMPPLTEKDLYFIKDHLSGELVAAKKAFQYAHQTMEPECKQLIQQVAQQHQQNLERILQHLSEHANQVMQSQQRGVQYPAQSIH